LACWCSSSTFARAAISASEGGCADPDWPPLCLLAWPGQGAAESRASLAIGLAEAPAQLASASAAARLPAVSPFAIWEVPVTGMLGAMEWSATLILPEYPARAARAHARYRPFRPHSKRRKFIRNLKFFRGRIRLI
jgi:hypothetical protein